MVLYFLGGWSLSDESFPNEGARGAFAKPSRSLQEGSAKPSRSVSSRRLRGASKAPPRTFRGGLRTLRGGCTYRRFHEDALEGSRGLLEGSVDELMSYSIMTVTVFGQYYTVFRTVDSSALFVVTVVLYYVYDSGSHWYLLL